MIMTCDHVSAPAGGATCCWSWSSPAARSAWSATPPAPPWPSPSTLTPASESCCLRRESSTLEEVKPLPRPVERSQCSQRSPAQAAPHPAAPAAPAAPPSTCEDSRVRSAAGPRWRWRRRRPTARCFPGVGKSDEVTFRDFKSGNTVDYRSSTLSGFCSSEEIYRWGGDICLVLGFFFFFLCLKS